MSWFYTPLLPGSADLLAGTAPLYPGYVKFWNGAQWLIKPVKVWDGSQWAIKPAKVWNGSQWAITNPTV